MIAERIKASSSDRSLGWLRSLISSAWLVALLLGLIAFVPRALNLADFYTIDEAYHWQLRVRLFAAALVDHNWAGTLLTGHPGVMTTWLGGIGRWLSLQAGVGEPGFSDGARYLSYLRLPLVVVNSATVVLGYLALRRLLNPWTALLAGLLWAASPFLIAHSRLLHVDALLTSFMTLSLLLLIIAIEATHEEPAADSAPRFGPRAHVVALAGSGVLAGLALLSKGPALAWLPLAGLFLLGFGPTTGIWPRLRWAIGRYLIWFGGAALTIFAVWPAMWVEPVEALGRVIGEVLVNGGQPHHSGNYFLGQPIGDPGWIFYPLVVLWRNTPLTLLGLLLLPLALRERSRERRILLILLLFALWFGLALSAGAKKFDRYLLPIWPATEILAAAGLVAGASWIGSWLERWGAVLGSTLRSGLQAAGLALVCLPLLLTDLAYHNYYLAYFNLLLGGGAEAQRVLLVGWGEGLEDAGAWLGNRPDVGNGPILSWISPTLMYFVPQQVRDLDAVTVRQLSSYAVLYSRSVQRKEAPEAEAYVRQTPPLYTVRKHGIEYATIHQLPRPFDQPVDAVFGAGLHLRGYAQELLQSTLTITPSWNIQADQPGGVFFFVHVLAPDGSKVSQVDLPLDDGLFPQWQAGQQFGRPLALPLPADLPAGEYRVALGVYQLAEGRRLPLKGGAVLPPEVDGAHTLLLTTLRIP
ncbi:MAG TPA: glycosyltransferase family 39 protein [Herpetosiphonaceae bacterium]